MPETEIRARNVAAGVINQPLSFGLLRDQWVDYIRGRPIRVRLLPVATTGEMLTSAMWNEALARELVSPTTTKNVLTDGSSTPPKRPTSAPTWSSRPHALLRRN